METFNETGAVDFLGLLAELDDAYAQVEQNTGVILSEGLLDYTVRAGLSLAGWKPVSRLSLRRWSFHSTLSLFVASSQKSADFSHSTPCLWKQMLSPRSQ